MTLLLDVAGAGVDAGAPHVLLRQRPQPSAQESLLGAAELHFLASPPFLTDCLTP